MKIKIEYKHLTGQWPCLAKTEVSDMYFVGLGRTFEEAKADLMNELKILERGPANEPEEIEI